jgi:hypothetical protein
MKKLTTRLKRILHGQIKNEKGQGTAEYILLLVAVVALVLMFRKSITKAVDENLGTLTGKMGEFNGSSSGGE